MVMVVFRDDDLVLARCDSLDLDVVWHSRCELRCDAFRHGGYGDDIRLDDGNRSGDGDVCAMCEYSDDSYDNLSKCSGDSSVDSSPNTKANDRLRRLATKTNRILRDELCNEVR